MFLITLVLPCAFSLAASAAQIAAMPRAVLALYSSHDLPTDHKDWYFTALHQHAEMPLNYLGLKLVYHDVAGPLPQPRDPAEYAGVVAWFHDPLKSVPRPDQYCRWLKGAVEAGLKIAILGDPGVLRPTSSGRLRISPVCRDVFKGLGYEFDSVIQPSALSWDVVGKDGAMVEFERKISLREAPEIILMKARGSRIYLRFKTNELASRDADAVALNSGGGMALSPFVIYDRPQPKSRDMAPARKSRWGDAVTSGSGREFRWRLNPFAFFEAAFGLKGRPRPDPTTLNGRRIFFSHVDGDGFFNVSETDQKSFSGEIFMNEILRRYPNMPFSVSLITGYYDLRRYQGDEVLSLSRRIMNLDNVEPASHGYAHPLIWERGTLSLDVPGYSFDPRVEILGSAKFIQTRILEPGKKLSLFLWTGDSRAGTDVLSLAEEAGLVTMNGGGTRFDRSFNSYGFVSALGRVVGPFRQIYTGQADENNFTDLWHGPYYGYRDVVETFERTDYPRRVKPVNVYVHYYSAEKLASLEALKGVYDWVLSRKLIPVFAGEYVGMARAFYDMRITLVSDGRYRLEGGRSLRTVRFDAETRVPDLSRSRNVIGFKREGRNLYVSLAEDEPREIALSDHPPMTPYLKESNFQISRWRAAPTRIAFLKRGWLKGEMILAGLDQGAVYRVSCGGWEQSLRARADSTLEVLFPDSELGKPAREVLVEKLP